MQDLIERLQLMPHPEGGFYRERHRSSLSVRRADGSERAAFTVIDFLLPAGVTSLFADNHVDRSATSSLAGGERSC